MSNAPCKDCKDRKPACHDTCETYKSWLSVEHEKKEHNNSHTNIYDNFHIDNIVKARRRYNAP